MLMETTKETGDKGDMIFKAKEMPEYMSFMYMWTNYAI
jgi:hypothetical protein